MNKKDIEEFLKKQTSRLLAETIEEASRADLEKILIDLLIELHYVVKDKETGQTISWKDAKEKLDL